MALRQWTLAICSGEHTSQKPVFCAGLFIARKAIYRSYIMIDIDYSIIMCDPSARGFDVGNSFPDVMGAGRHAFLPNQRHVMSISFVNIELGL